MLHTVQFSIPLRLYRITRVAHPNPAYYGRGRTFRFDAPDGSYGVCLHCEEDIKPKRLDAVPWTKYCIRCQEAADRHEFESETGESIDELLAA